MPFRFCSGISGGEEIASQISYATLPSSPPGTANLTEASELSGIRLGHFRNYFRGPEVTVEWEVVKERAATTGPGSVVASVILAPDERTLHGLRLLYRKDMSHLSRQFHKDTRTLLGSVRDVFRSSGTAQQNFGRRQDIMLALLLAPTEEQFQAA
ncbi:hypothetical protein P4O66_007390 [Electrophorus voltai]|uniref:Uncharacterized protein n=1 Tax=Electrophorus voltai TaxID=2609070 RepID=A0AAD8ZKD8_9TELE|nr:hypothetical protein P4O66_007390 [Electrophorus voltai]